MPGTGVAYALEKICDPGRGRKDRVSLTIAKTSLQSLRAESERILTWANEKGAALRSHIHEFNTGLDRLEKVLGNYTTPAQAESAANEVLQAYERLWAAMQKY